MNGASWAQWQTVAVAGLVVLLVYSGTIWAGMAAADLAGIPVAVGWVTGLVVGYVLSGRMLRWVLARTVMRRD